MEKNVDQYIFLEFQYFSAKLCIFNPKLLLTFFPINSSTQKFLQTSRKEISGYVTISLIGNLPIKLFCDRIIAFQIIYS